MKKLGRKIGAGILMFLSAALIAGNVVCFKVLGVDFINSALGGSGVSKIDEETAKKGASLVKKISEDGCVLLKNENHALPLDKATDNKVNVFGYTSIDNGWVFSGVGSGSCLPDPEKRVGFLQGLENAGLEYNHDLAERYKKAINTKDPWLSVNQNGKILQPGDDFYSDELISSCKSFSDTAIVVLSRISGENVGEIPTSSVDYLSGKEDKSRSYLELSQKEEHMLDVVKNSFKKVIVVLNTTNNMQCGFLNDEKIQAALYCGPTGLCGAEGVANLICGEKSVVSEDGTSKTEKLSFSGKLADTYAYDYQSEPAFANSFVRNKSATGGNIVYQEGLYFGYRWYETADREGFFDGLEKGYDSAVLYPFGYGLSYTSFSWKLTDVSLKNGSSLEKDSTIDVEVEVTNTGDYPGKDVVELYYSAPYEKGGIEKSAICLGDFAKTSVLQPNEKQKVKLSLRAYDMASYDCYDMNHDGHTGYELDKGDYVISFREDVHHEKQMENSSLTYHLPDIIDYSKDIDTGYDVINRFTGDDGYASIALDGSNVGINAEYLSRRDFVSTFIDKQAALPKDTSKVNKARIYKSGANNQEEMPLFDQDNGNYLFVKEDGSKPTKDDLTKRTGIKYNDALIDELLKDPYGKKWDELLDQLSKEDACALVEKSGFGSQAMASIGKMKTLDFDGPSGFNQNTQKIAEDKSSWTSYPAECVIGTTWNTALADELGRSVAYEADKSGINGWYAPGVNLHRSNYNGRNYEYYSEDPLISGKLASATIQGAKKGGLYCYLKHFALSEEGDNAKGVDTWITEQAFREVYLKPFEIAVKGGANAIMTAFNRIGPVWAGACYDLLTEILRNEWGFLGSVVTDWSSGDEIMNTNRGVVAGNDLWLNPMNSNGAPLDKKDPTEMYCAKEAVRHNVYTFISTYQARRDYNPDSEKGNAVVIVPKAEGGSWWIPTLISIDVVVFLSTVVLSFFAFFPFEKRKDK